MNWDAIAESLAEPPRTLIHGDFRMPNIAHDGDRPDPYVFLDWQFAAHARGGWDVGHFSLWTTLRMTPDEYERRLSDSEAIYLAALRELGVRDYSPGQLHSDATLYLGWAVIVMGLVYWRLVRRKPDGAHVGASRMWRRVIDRAQRFDLLNRIGGVTR